MYEEHFGTHKYTSNNTEIVQEVVVVVQCYMAKSARNITSSRETP